jgi:hypothetical protein
MIGSLTTAPGGFTRVLVAIVKFTKWIEYKTIATLNNAHLRHPTPFWLPQHHHYGSGVQFPLASVMGFL